MARTVEVRTEKKIIIALAHRLFLCTCVCVCAEGGMREQVSEISTRHVKRGKSECVLYDYDHGA